MLDTNLICQTCNAHGAIRGVACGTCNGSGFIAEDQPRPYRHLSEGALSLTLRLATGTLLRADATDAEVERASAKKRDAEREQLIRAAQKGFALRLATPATE